MEQCRYFHVPVGNLPKDTTSFGADLFYARHLRKQNFVLWCSPTEKPDLGGKEADDNRLMTEAEDASLSVVVNSPGAYRTVCVEIEVDALAVNTLLQSHHVNDIEGTAGSVAFDAAPHASLEEMLGGQASTLVSYDETALVSSAFRILRTMVSAWLREVSQYRNVFADYQIIHFYRWLRSPNAYLYDPALRKTLLNLMKKLFAQLVSEFRRLGATVVYADFNRIILCTKKRSLKDAISYVDYITSTIRTKELFHSVDMRFSQAWDYLLWCDPSNYGGVRSKQLSNNQSETPRKGNKEMQKDILEESGTDGETEEREKENDGEETEDEDDSPEVEMHWNLASYLPEAGACQKNFNTVIVGYLTANYQFLQEEVGRVAPGMTPVRRRRTQSSQTQTPRNNSQGRQNNEENQSVEEYAQELVSGELSQRLFAVTQKIHKKLPEHVGVDANPVFPVLPGSYLKLTNPALEFIKALCKVLSLDSAIVPQVNKLKRNLLRLIGVGEFSDAAEWKDPCISFVLPEVICKQCNHCRDIDLCKDPFVSTDGTPGQAPVWICASPECRTPYDSAEIEHLLLDAIQRRTMGYVLQDLTCLKCGQVKASNMAKHCTCAGKFVTMQSTKELEQLLHTFASIASHYRMPLLLEVVEMTLRMNHFIN